MATKKRDQSALFGLRVSVGLNAALVLFIWAAYQIANNIPLVINSPTRYSVLVVPFALGAIAAALVSFLPYLDLPRWQVILPLLGAVIAGFAITLFFWDFPPDRSTLIADYIHRLNFINFAILAFATITFICSGLKFFQTLHVPPNSKHPSPEHQRGYWASKALVCDLPIVVGAGIIAAVQEHSINAAHQNFTEIYFAILKSTSVKLIATPETFVVGEVQRDLANANFWIGVALGVTGVQLIMQQVSSLALEVIFWFRHHLI